MNYLSSLFSLLFFLTSIMYLFWGVNIFRANMRSSINKMFLLMCISLAVWSLGLSVATTAPNIESALFWRRFSAIGWTSVYSIILHFIILLTKSKYSKVKNPSLYFLHIPALINLYIFSLSQNISPGQYDLVNSIYGWTNVSVGNI